ncbi:MAG: hypothetical protein A2Y96_02790 [Firmicutes bacterium RBG_13_65_8]|nr:MAG: hypothetical protein A2Y96_02790 [Firmicutes bacterium RBG_13_65_8]
MRVVKLRGWHIAVLVLALAALLALGAADGGWWGPVIRGRPIPFTQLSIAELPLPLIEAYSETRWSEGVDACLDSAAGDLYILLRWGQQPTGGYRVVPKDVRVVRRWGQCQIRIRSDYVVPAPGQPVIEVATFPAAGLRITLQGIDPYDCTVVAFGLDGRPHGATAPLRRI